MHKMMDLKTLINPKHNDSMRLQLITESNEVIEFVAEKIEPFSFTDLQEIKGDENISFKFNVSTLNVDLASIGEQVSGSAKISSNIVFHNKPKLFTLLDGGWLPPGLVNPPNLLVDRNVISVLLELLNGSDRADHVSTDWWLNLPDSSKLEINPLLYALEGNKKQTPSFDEFRQAFVDASIVIRTKFPNTKVTEFNLIQYEAAYDHVLKCSARLENETKFLKKIVEFIYNPVGANDRTNCKKKVLQTADAFDLNRRSLVVLAALSCIYEPRGGAGFLAARQVLKPKQNYQESDAFNALSDLRALEIFIAFSSIEASEVYFCTCDRALAGLWCGMNPRNARWENNVLNFDLSINESLFPSLPIEDRTEKVLLGY